MLGIARDNLKAAGAEGLVPLKQMDILDGSPPAGPGIVVMNPPYGERQASADELAAFYPKLGNALKQRYAGRVEFDWKIALMRKEDYPASREQCDWFYRRSGMLMKSPFMLHSGWLEPWREGLFPAASYVAEAGKDFGITGDELRLALAHAADREGLKVASMGPAIEVAVKATKLDGRQLQARAESPEVERPAV